MNAKSIIVGIIFLIIGAIIFSFNLQTCRAKSEKFYDALQIQSSDLPTAISNTCANVFINGQLMTNKPVTHNKINGEYMNIFVSHEKLTPHIRHSTTIVGKVPVTTSHTVYTWDRIKSESLHTDKVIYCGLEFPYNKFDFSKCKTNRSVYKIDTHHRIVFHTINTNINATVFTHISNNTIADKSLIYQDESIQELLNRKTTFYSPYIILIIYLIIIGIVWFNTVYDD